MNITFVSAKPCGEPYFACANEKFNHQLRFLESRLTADLVDAVTSGPPDDTSAICAFVNDVLDKEALSKLFAAGIRLVALRWINNVDLVAADKLGI